MKKISIYTLPSCVWCHRVKDYFKEKAIEYQEIDVTDPEKAREMVEISGQRGTPVIMIEKAGGPPEVVVGFDQERLEAFL